MAATQPPKGPDRTTEEIPAEPDNMKDQLHSSIPESSISSNSSQGTATIGHSRETTSQSGYFGSGGDRPLYPPNVYAPQAQAFYYRGFDNGNGEWDEYPSYVNSEGLEIGSPGVYNENPSLIFHSGYGFNPQMPYGPYSPVTTPLPSVGGDAQLYSPQQFPYTGPPYYHQLVPPSLPYLNTPTPVSQPDLTNLVGIDQQVDSMFFGPRAGYASLGSFGRGSFPIAPGSFSFHEPQQGFDGSRSGGIWSDCSKPSEMQRSLMPLPSSVSPQPIESHGSFGLSVGMVSHQQRSLYGFGSGSNSYGRGYLPNHGSNFGGTGISSLTTNDRSFLSPDNSRRQAKATASLCNYNGTLDILSEQNRGPRGSKMKNQISSENSSVDNSKKSASTVKFQNESLNRPDFATDYKDARFFVIKSYSEDNVHKSIKYGVWASTPNGNKKLDAAYRQAEEKQDACPIFLFFSVNASAQFCGVAEMVGPVNFDKSVDFWQQDKWSGQFPVKWHIIKDVPNSQFRHIVLENNDNKPVTNSRDTQEVKLQQGIEMLTIFKNYETDVSILDDFDFYEDRQKVMQERKARQQSSMIAVGLVGESEHRSSANVSGDFIKQISKSFAQVVRLDENSNEVIVADRGNLASDGPIGKPDDGISVTASSTQTN
ncbi:YTH domain-containing protein ECT4 isoform X3 [Gastrolobium bilobum]|uniref:YTH domain-containing protein ECT4 isoform X3 n=1 Tax=Gastrolobium bilobum TaxID=150636 RepID=UPI002AB080F9|nr:YTH domain-containing protein ECT4 isoform X3 [Gastrolobium bilobum]